MKELRIQFANALLVVLTVAIVASAFINFQQNFHPERRFRLPEDGVTWVDRKAPDGSGRVEALDVAQGSPGEKAGLRAGDHLLKIHGTPIKTALDVAKVLAAVKPWHTADYVAERRGIEFPAKVYVGERVPDYTVSFQYGIGLVYLAIGIFVYLRRGNAAKALHFLVLCLASFVLSTFHYTGKLNEFDKYIYWGNIVAGIFAPTIFLHFCLTFPEPRGWLRKPGRSLLIYVPGTILLLVTAGIVAGNLQIDMSPIELRWLLDRALLAFYSFTYLMGAAALAAEYRLVTDPIVRQQIKWLRNGALVGIVPFSLFYVLPYILGFTPGSYMNWAVLFLPFLPLTWAYAIVRYRLMDVDVIFQQGYVYTIATLAVLGIFYSLYLTLGKIDDLSPSALVALVLVATFVFQPIRNWVQEMLDRYYFYRGQYDYRRTLVEFARELSSETDLLRMLDSVAERLLRTLDIKNVGIFIRRDCTTEPGGFELAHWAGRADRPYGNLDLSFLPIQPVDPYLFFERTRHALDVVSREMPISVRHTISDLDLTYFVPCLVRGRTIAYMGVSRTVNDDFLSSDDVELLSTLSGYLGIAIENARLYHSLQRKVDEYERLKEFSENIVESINVGILASDLHDRVESWNTRLEELTGIPRQYALGRTLQELFPADLTARVTEIKGDTEVHNVYKFPYKESVLNLAIAPLFSKEMREIGRLIIFDDITDRSELERRLVQADKLSSIGLLAAGVAHEVNTPLAVISTYAQMLAKQVSGDEAKAKLLEKIAKQTFRASEIVNSLLNFSRTSPAAFSDIDLNRIVEETVSLVKHQLEKNSVTLQMDLQATLPLIKGDSGKLQQVFLNLVINARDAMETAGGRLCVRTWSNGGCAHVEVSDTGQGITPDNLSRIYDPFFTTKAARKGTGLGLSITYGIVREHGGTIEVQSEVGAGTLFHLEFPLARTAEAPLRAIDAAATNA